MSLFRKALVFTDIHFGLKSNSQLHNEDCLDFVKWATELGRSQGCDTAMFLGDWHNHRASINIVTLDYSLQALEHLNANFGQVFFIPGNHDLYYRDKRDIQSVAWARNLPNVIICNDWFQQDDVVIAPWLVGDDHERIRKLKGRYMFGHFELPHFKMNAMVEMPDHGELNAGHFGNFGDVFSGHFHLRQSKQNVTYIGNCFPHNFADVDDEARGCMILEWGQEPVYHAWPQQPLYRIMDLSTLIDRGDELLREKMHVRVHLDIDISYEEASYIKDRFVRQHGLREMALIPNQRGSFEEDLAPGETRFESVDQIVVDQLTKIDSQHYDPKLLLEIYQTL
jgi:hypothetical protein